MSYILTDEFLKRYEGGQMEIQNSNEHYLYRGEVEHAWIENSTLHVRFKWLAKMGDDSKWYAEDNLDYAISLEITSASEIGEGRIHYSVMYVWENGTLFPPDGSKLDPTEVIGLQLAS